jgi:Predicted transmembrane sensor domain
MKIYKRALITIIWGFLWAPLAALLTIVVGGFFVKNLTLLIYIGITVAALVLLYYLLWQSIRFTVSEDGTLSCYKLGILKKQFDIRECRIGYNRKTTNFIYHTMTLKILHTSNEKTTEINVTPLGKNRFEKMYKQLEEFALK